MRRFAFTALALAAAATPLPTYAQTADDCFQATTRTDDQAIIRICTQALERGGLTDQTRSITISNRGLGYLRNKEYDKSIVDFSDALLLNPKNPFAFNNRGEAWLNKNNFDRAFADFDDSLRADPAFTAAMYQRGVAFERQGNANAAKAEYRKALAQTGTRPIDTWARDRARERLVALGETVQQQQPQRPDERRNTRETEERQTGPRETERRSEPGRGNDGSYIRRNN